MEISQEILALTKDQILTLALTAGRILLCNGAETYRVEDTMMRICALGGMKTVSAFCTPSVIMLGDELIPTVGRMYRVKNRTINLQIISEINDFSFRLHNRHDSYETILNELLAKEQMAVRPYYIDVLCTCLAGAAFTLVFGGAFKEFVAAALCCFFATIFTRGMRAFRPSNFWITTMAGGIISVVALGFCRVVPTVSMELIISGAIMPYVPGMAFTNGLRDYIAGDLISGNSRVSEAIFQVGGLVIGIATVLGLFYH